MKIGTDISLAECRKEGYMVIEFRVKELYPNGRKNGIDKDHPVNCTKSLPEHCRYGYVGEQIIYMDVDWSWNDLVELYLRHREGIDSMIGSTYDVENMNPTEYDILHLASDIDMYCGIGD